MIVKVALAVPPTYLLDYRVDEQNVNLFDRVLVQVGKRQLIGFIVVKNVTVNYEITKIKPIIKLLDKPISLQMQKIIQWVANYYCSDLYSAIRLALPNDYFKHEVITPSQEVSVYIDQIKLQDHKPTLKQQQLLANFKEKELISLEELKTLGSVHVINGLFKKGILIKKIQLKNLFTNASENDCPKKLAVEQQKAVETILNTNAFKVFLLYGVTGSGKTEVYLQTISKYLEKLKQVLVLIPEINLTPQTVKRFKQRFNNKKTVVLHSKLSEKARLTNWLNIKEGNADIIISTRSGVLADFKDLGVIIVDEEHDNSFKQQTSTIRYNARDLAIFRAKELNISIILGSATPSIESYYNALAGKYKLLQLKNRALNNYLNEIRLLDLKSSIVDNGISNTLFSLLEKNINSHQQSLIFINKLGFAKALVCKVCGDAIECKKCDKPYTLHTQPYQYLECHFCSTRKPLVVVCSSCGGELFTYGVGTEKIQSRLEARFPYNKIIRFDRNNIKTINDLNGINKMINSNMVDIVVGTQMIAKGHDFENITLVGLVNIDAGLYSADFHAIEKTAQTIIQVSGRAGRADKQGLVLLQTYQPENRLLQLLVSKGYLEFLDYLLEQRKYANYPPYTYQAQVIAESKKETDILEYLNTLYGQLSFVGDITISKPLPALHLKKNNIYRYSLLMTSQSRKHINTIIRWIKNTTETQPPKSIKLYFDIDPIELG
ncbi:primosomal protein N' [Allofrancisella guangzhouensis]|uniref:Replication restart protein PriA n=1 Tax=Allofrancisella guangzhouensis TaxID=594679 RepID=A0A0A8E3M8_9GAMM|nr:primosomal protein N' [Allofrancisella guangzhouensis]AJC48544.1 primosomal protein N' [Allofrancisella guangzhouensis]MBK2027793.1 primosomal protein N' [Allofrancisella guangzhouensis]MBK2044783.1 primosomal protein N' [Allofrancisella guangzhouensis]MBK2045766.1 primosomal protein N' [Allofrancisella guangzhouensis]